MGLVVLFTQGDVLISMDQQLLTPLRVFAAETMVLLTKWRDIVDRAMISLIVEAEGLENFLVQ